MEEQNVAQTITVSTNGKWMLLEDIVNKGFEIGKTYKIKVKGRCEFMISQNEPTIGVATSEITFTKRPEANVWIKTGV